MGTMREQPLSPRAPGTKPTNAPRNARQHPARRYRLQHLLPPALRLVLGLVGALPESSAVRGDARLFVGAHYRAIDRWGLGPSEALFVLMPCGTWHPHPPRPMRPMPGSQGHASQPAHGTPASTPSMPQGAA